MIFRLASLKAVAGRPLPKRTSSTAASMASSYAGQFGSTGGWIELRTCLMNTFRIGLDSKYGSFWAVLLDGLAERFALQNAIWAPGEVMKLMNFTAAALFPLCSLIARNSPPRNDLPGKSQPGMRNAARLNLALLQFDTLHQPIAGEHEPDFAV